MTHEGGERPITEGLQRAGIEYVIDYLNSVGPASPDAPGPSNEEETQVKLAMDIFVSGESLPVSEEVFSRLLSKPSVNNSVQHTL